MSAGLPTLGSRTVDRRASKRADKKKQTVPSPKPSTDDDVLVIDLNDLSQTELSQSLSRVVPEAIVQSMLGSTDAHVEGPGALSLSIQSIGETMLLVRGDFRVQLSVPCARCLEPAAATCRAELCAQAVKGAVTAQAKSKGSRSRDEDEDIEVDLDAPDTLVYSGHTLDLRDIITEQVVMAYPMRILCSLGEACRGLCHSCGRDLNGRKGSDGSPACTACSKPGDPEPPAEVESAANSPWKAALQAIREREDNS